MIETGINNRAIIAAVWVHFDRKQLVHMVRYPYVVTNDKKQDKDLGADWEVPAPVILSRNSLPSSRNAGAPIFTGTLSPACA